MFVRSCAIGVLFFAQIGLAQAPDAERVAPGQRLFETNCTACHGQNAKGGRGPNLTGRLRHGSLESEMADNITGGIPGTQMPAFPMSPENVRAIVAYLRSLSEGGPDLAIAGNTASGQQVVFRGGALQPLPYVSGTRRPVGSGLEPHRGGQNGAAITGGDFSAA